VQGMGIRTVAVYSDADAHALHVKACDEAVHIGPAEAAQSYLRADRILAAAQASGAQAIHPGYGFLSENADFARACEAAGITFIGPSAAAMAAMGDKSAAKALMAQTGVPLVPGYHGEVQEAAFLQAQADAIGYPVLIKASAGGGGKGMRVVEHAADFAAALASCQREAQASFGQARVLIERYLCQPRHIEIQLFGDQHGQYVYLFERDCSVQRRHQKVLEEAPAPGMTPALRQQMGEAAVAAARAVGYVGAGTVEFICEQGCTAGVASTSFYFMEMNTRLQVEHPVTEAITGLDLVEWQLRVAAGEPLPLQQSALQIKGHAIEARICAENPSLHFLPATGPLRVMRTPQACAFEVGPVRIDSGVQEGDVISTHYDSMIAKLIVWGDTRDAALRQMDAALGALHITGLHTNVDVVRRVIHTASFAQARLDTALIEREHTALFDAPGVPLEMAVGAGMACLLAGLMRWPRSAAPDRPNLAHSDPWSATDSWRLHGQAVRHERLRIGEHEVQVRATIKPPRRPQADEAHGLTATLHFQDQTLQLLIHPGSQGDALDISLHPLGPHIEQNQGPGPALAQGLRQRIAAYRHATATGEQLDLFTPQGHIRIQRIDPLQHQASDAASAQGGLTALMPGKVIALLVAPGQAVKQGQALAVTEAMKMEHTLTAPRDGVIASILCAVGDQVGEGAELLRIS